MNAALGCESIALMWPERSGAYAEHDYWGRPVPNFGPRNAKLLIVGLAPGAHGANRTGRMFTGDRSGDWLYRSLHKNGFATQAESVSMDDGLRLTGCAITAACPLRLPPDNKPTTDELHQCADWFAATVRLVNASVFVALGGIAWNATFRLAKEWGWHQGARPKFGHGVNTSSRTDLPLLGVTIQASKTPSRVA